MTEVKWLKDCELCNNGVCKRIDEYREQGMSVRAASEQMEQDCDGLWDAAKIRGRYRYYKKGQTGGGGNPPTQLTDDKILIMAEEVYAYRINDRINRVRAAFLKNACPNCDKEFAGCDTFQEVCQNIIEDKEGIGV